MGVWKNSKKGEDKKTEEQAVIESNYKVSDDEVEEKTESDAKKDIVDLNDVEVVIDKIDDEINKSENQEDKTAAVESEEKEKKKKEKPKTKQSVEKQHKSQGGYNAFDRFFISLWAVMVASVTTVSKGINYCIRKIFKHELPIRYLNAFIVILIVVLLVYLITVPVKLSYEEEKLEIYTNNLVAVQKSVGNDTDGNPIYKWGYVDKFGKVKIDFQYEEAKPFCSGGALVKVSNVENGAIQEYWVVIDGKGNEKSERYNMVGNFDKDTKLCWAVRNGKYGFVNTSGKTVINFAYDGAEDFSEGYACVKFGDVYYYIDKYGKKKSYEYAEIRSFNEGFGAVKAANGKWGFVNSKGKEVITCYYDMVSDFIDGYAVVCLGEAVGIINTNGKYVLDPDYKDISLSYQ